MATPSHWDILDETVSGDCEVFKIFRRRYRHPRDSREGVFYVIKSPDWVLALPLTTDGRLVLVRQFRAGVGELSWEPPGGIMEANEEPVEAAIRELAEETGYTGENARIIGTCAPNPAIFNNTSHFVIVENCRLTRPIAPDPNEELETALFTPREAAAMAANGEIHHAIAHAALFHLHLAKPEVF
ncbi:MAG: NUDIX hydrolase [Puniceicoccales bacterium]|jgi:8-oxo-dGTP pyrophosphatase MutT (NUDIX family)|nr:NUDIX hydrolase [Puniceicoccales bacterium]